MPSASQPVRSAGAARVVASTVSLLATGLLVMAEVLAVVGATATPAQAKFDDTQKWGYAKVIDPETYLRYYVHWGIQVVHVDEEHMDADGFWFAYGGADTPERDFVWQYQPFGAWCHDTALTVQWNPWLNTYQCQLDPTLAEAEWPGTATATARCRETTGHPWKQGYWNTDYCGNQTLAASYVQQAAGMGHSACAPWEDQGVTLSGSAKCLTQRYAWENTTPNTYWSPAPDTCTGMPPEATRRAVNPDPYVPSGPVPDCTGEPLATNCPADSVRQACTGVPMTFARRTADASATVTDATGSATATRSATATAITHKVTKTVKATYRGKTYKASKTVKITAQATKTATATFAIKDGTATRTASATCARLTEDLALSCAQAAADASAALAARDAAITEANARAQVKAAESATRMATAMATSKAASTTVSQAQKKAAAQKALKRATKAVRKAIAKAKKRG